MAKPVARRPMTEDEQDMARHLTAVRFLPATFDKHMGQQLGARARAAGETGTAAEISEEEAAQLVRLVHRYRGQLPDEVAYLAGLYLGAPS